MLARVQAIHRPDDERVWAIWPPMEPWWMLSQTVADREKLGERESGGGGAKPRRWHFVVAARGFT